MTSFTVTKRYIFDPLQLALMIEAVAGPYLRKIQYRAGAYIEGSDTPLIVFDRNYYCIKIDSHGISNKRLINCIGDISGNVFNGNGELVTTVRNTSFLLSEPTYPIRGIKIIQEYVNKILTDNSAWVNRGPLPTSSLWHDYISHEYLNTGEVYDLIENLLVDVRVDLKDFIGDDRWFMFFQNMRVSDIIIERTCDYRVHSWMEEHGHEL
jgi:hypothetical protein